MYQTFYLDWQALAPKHSISPVRQVCEYLHFTNQETEEQSQLPSPGSRGNWERQDPNPGLATQQFPNNELHTRPHYDQSRLLSTHKSTWDWAEHFQYYLFFSRMKTLSFVN